MRTGQLLTYVDRNGTEHAATLREITGAGKSTFKIITLTYGDKATEVKDVPHYQDHESGKGYWLLPSEAEKYPERRAPLEKQPVEMMKAEAEGKLPTSDRRKPQA